MKYYGSITHDNDLVTKKYVDDQINLNLSPYIIQSQPPSNTNKIWIKDGVPYYYDSTQEVWLSFRFTTDASQISPS